MNEQWQEWARRFLPVCQFCRGEVYYPCSVGAYTNRARLKGPLSSKNAYWRLSGQAREAEKSSKPPPLAPVYIHFRPHLQRPDLLDIVYVFFYSYNSPYLLCSNGCCPDLSHDQSFSDSAQAAQADSTVPIAVDSESLSSCPMQTSLNIASSLCCLTPASLTCSKCPSCPTCPTNWKRGLGGCAPYAGAHDADFEHVAVRLNVTNGSPVALYCSRHGKGQWTAWKGVRKASKTIPTPTTTINNGRYKGKVKGNGNGNGSGSGNAAEKKVTNTDRPIIYVARGSHASYALPALYCRIAGAANDDVRRGCHGLRWAPDPIQNVQWLDVQPIPQWLAFRGNWNKQGLGGLQERLWWTRAPVVSATESCGQLPGGWPWWPGASGCLICS